MSLGPLGKNLLEDGPMGQRSIFAGTRRDEIRLEAIELTRHVSRLATEVRRALNPQTNTLADRAAHRALRTWCGSLEAAQRGLADLCAALYLEADEHRITEDERRLVQGEPEAL